MQNEYLAGVALFALLMACPQESDLNENEFKSGLPWENVNTYTV